MEAPRGAPASGAQPLAPARAARRDHPAATRGPHAGAETVTALAHELARLIRPLHEWPPRLAAGCNVRLLFPVCRAAPLPAGDRAPELIARVGVSSPAAYTGRLQRKSNATGTPPDALFAAFRGCLSRRLHGPGTSVADL